MSRDGEPPIRHFHAHVYFETGTREVARRVYEGLLARFAIDHRWREAPIGPHSRANFRVRFSPEEFGQVVPWLMFHRDGLSVLVHPDTGDRVGDHTERALWLGERLALNVEFLRRLDAEEAQPSG
jgi:aromatic ring-cleaving dioxygenase